MALDQIIGKSRHNDQNESDIAYRGFLLWCMCKPAERKAYRVAKAMKTGESTVRKWLIRYRWPERAGADPTAAIRAAAIYGQRFYATHGDSEVGHLGSRLEHAWAPPPDVKLTPKGEARQGSFEAEHAEDVENRTFLRGLIRGSMGELAKALKGGHLKVRGISDLRALIQAAMLLEARPEIGAGDGAEAGPILESVRVQQAKASTDPNALLRALVDDARELVVITEALLGAAETAAVRRASMAGPAGTNNVLAIDPTDGAAAAG